MKELEQQKYLGYLKKSITNLNDYQIKIDSCEQEAKLIDLKIIEIQQNLLEVEKVI